MGEEEEEEKGDTEVSVDKRRNLTIRKISGEEVEERSKRFAPGGARRKYTRRVVRMEAMPSSHEEHQGIQDIQSQSDITNLLTSEAFLDKVVSFRYLDDDTH